METTKTVQMNVPHEIADQVQDMMEKLALSSTALKEANPRRAMNVRHQSTVEGVTKHRIVSNQFKYYLTFSDGSCQWVHDDSTDCELLIARYNKTANIRTAYAIVRVSTKQQAADNTLSLKGQMASIRDKVGDGCDRLKVVSITKSAYKSIPEKIQAVGEAANPGDTIIVYRVDRLSRNLVLSLGWLEDLNDRGVEVTAVIDAVAAIDGDSEELVDRCLTYRENTLTFVQAVLDAQKEAKMLSNKMKRAIKERRERGDEAIGGLPYGRMYKRSVDGSNRLLVTDDPEAHRVMNIIKKLWTDEYPMLWNNTTKLASAVAAKLRAKGVKKKNRLWSVQMVRNVIKMYSKMKVANK
jgi:DNA invertase Pin-like site-specific DNA recombinase